MLLNQFPDLTWLQEQAKTNFANQQAVDKSQLPRKGWPSVVLNVNSSQAERPNILAPFSLFMNLEGNGRVHVDGKENELSSDSFCLVNKGQSYDLIIPDSAKTFNVHFGDQLVKEVAFECSENPDHLINEVSDLSELPEVFNRLRWKGQGLRNSIGHMQDFYLSIHSINPDEEYELLADLLRQLLVETGDDRKLKHRISSKKKSTKEELLRRLVVSQDFIHSHFGQNISVDELSQVSSLSKYHFLRCFRDVFGCSPHQYHLKLKIEKAQGLIKNTNLPIKEIAWQLNFEEPASFNKAFRKMTGSSPSFYRASN